ncbi:MAG TPA: PilZ domain-containing protein [Allosphingosinicella sp.]|nr:PilZ domain-containing protein [Allosphingosinicella sp.]
MHEIRSTILTGEARAGSPVARKAKSRSGEAPSGLTRIAIKRQEARVTDHRSEDRHRAIVERSTLIFRRRRIEVGVINVSSRGAMVVAEVEPRIGEKVDIVLSGDNRTRCIVRWVREGRIGLEFENETIFWDGATAAGPVFQYEQRGEAKEPAEAPRPVVEREERQKLLRAGTLYWSGISIPVRLRNISSNGAKIESERELVPGAEVELDLGEAGFQMAEVRWSKDGQIGLRFAEEFNFEALTPGKQAAAPPEVLKPAYLETETRPDSPWAARFERLSLTDLKMIDPER